MTLADKDDRRPLNYARLCAFVGGKGFGVGGRGGTGVAVGTGLDESIVLSFLNQGRSHFEASLSPFIFFRFCFFKGEVNT